VTLLFSDIEGSTALLRRLGDRYAETLSAQRSLLRAAFAEHGGVELGTEGDSFFVVFESASDAVRSCVAGQRALASHDWPEGAAVRVRMGLHSGEPARLDDGYVGMDVHRAARIAAAAHGGQVVLSDPARQLAEAQLPPGVRALDLGWHRLRDIESPEHLYQLAAAGLPGRFPPLKSLGTQASLPVPRSPLVGRDNELAELCAHLGQPAVRLVTLTGTGGVGKTRLALAAAAAVEHSFPRGVFFVRLAPVTSADVMWKAIAETLDVSSDQSTAAAVARHLGAGRCLLVLDNLEQLTDAGQVVSELLAAAPGPVVLATSRRPLHVQGEQERPVQPLTLPAAAGAGYEQAAASGAVRLFSQQAKLVRPGFTLTPENFADVTAICHQLDGLPLAIELAAARAKLLSPAAILTRLGESLALAAADVGRPSRQQTLRSTIAWSYDLLGPGLQQIYRRTGVFQGGCDLGAFTDVALAGQDEGSGIDPLDRAAELLDASMIIVTEGVDGEPRIRMLETLRRYALERLGQEDGLEAARRRHAEHYAAFTERARDQLAGRAYWAWLDRLEVEHDNLRAALSWSLDSPATGPAAGERAAIGLRLVQNLASFWYQHGHAREAVHWLERAVELAAGDAGAPLARVAHWLGVLLQQRGDNAAAIGVFERSLAIWRDLGDTERTAVELNSLAITHRGLGDQRTARSLFEASIAAAREVGSDMRLSTALSNLGILEVDEGNLTRAEEVLREALALDQKLGHTWGATISQASIATAKLLAGRVAEAQRLLASILDDVISSGDLELMAGVFELTAGIAAHQGDSARAARLTGAGQQIRDGAGIPITANDAALLERLTAPARAATAPGAWEAGLATGRELSQPAAAALLAQSVDPARA
jgi:predicted ATPase/class 3 adenylate cyclase